MDGRDKAWFANLLAFQNVNHIAGTGIEYSLLGRTVFLERHIPKWAAPQFAVRQAVTSWLI